MAEYGFLLRSPDGEPLMHIPTEAWLYFEAELKVNDVGSAQGILSTRRFPNIARVLNILENENLDAVLEVWRTPNRIKGLPASPPQLINHYLLRYERMEHLVNGKPRKIAIFRDAKHLLSRALVYPPGDLPLIVSDDATLATAISSYMTGVPPVPVVTADYYTGPPAPSDTIAQMVALVSHCKANTPIPLAPIIVPPLSQSGGIPDHRFQFRYENSVLLGLQRLSGASWYAWYHNLMSTSTPVDFDILPSSTTPYFPWSFTVFPGGRGVDRRIGMSDYPVILSPENDNVSYPNYITDRLDEKTVTVIGGSGSKSARDVLRVVDADRVSDSIWNWNEFFTHASKVEAFNVAGGVEEAHQYAGHALRQKGIRREVNMRMRNTTGVQYGVHVSLGDLVTVSFEGREDSRQVSMAKFKLYGDKAEEIEFELGELNGKQFEGSDNFKRVLNAINGIEEDSDYYGQDY